MADTTTFELSFKAYYNNTDFKRQYELKDIPQEAAAASVIRGKVNAINESLAGGTATLLANIFVADNYNQAQSVGTLKYIDDVIIKRTEETIIPRPQTRIYEDQNFTEPADINITEDGEENQK